MFECKHGYLGRYVWVFAVWINDAAHRLLEQAIDLLTLFFDQRPCALLDSAEGQIYQYHIIPNPDLN